MWKRSRPILLAGICVSLANCSDPGPAADGAANEPTRDRSIEESFAEMDADNDGFLSREETRSEPALASIFALSDRDQDGKLNVPEYSHATLEGVRASPDAAGGPLFIALDSDENGRITREEAGSVPQLEENFDTFDEDANGTLDEQEYAAARDEGLTPGSDY